MKKLAIIVVMISFLTGCATTGQNSKLPSQEKVKESVTDGVVMGVLQSVVYSVCSGL
jgi:PBP1b-binding outer membrane lipoprotein LpoB